MKIKPEYKAKWVAALRSGKYKQAYGDLTEEKQEGTCHCVMGVLAQEVDPTYYKWNPNGTILDREFMEIVLAADLNKLPKNCGNMFHLQVPKLAVPKISIHEDRNLPDHISVVELNDTHELSFNQLADLIESYL